MKKLIVGSLIASMLVVPAMAQDISVYLNNQRMVFDQNPIIENGRTLVPLRSIFEGLGAEVKWNPEIQEVRGITEDKEVVLRVGDTSASVNGDEVILDVPAKIENGRTLVPLRFISESLGTEVKWDAEECRIDIVNENIVDASIVKQIFNMFPTDVQAGYLYFKNLDEYKGMEKDEQISDMGELLELYQNANIIRKLNFSDVNMLYSFEYSYGELEGVLGGVLLNEWDPMMN